MKVDYKLQKQLTALFKADKKKIHINKHDNFICKKNINAKRKVLLVKNKFKILLKDKK